MTYKHEGPFESFLDGKKPNIPAGRAVAPYPDLELWNTRRILELLLSRFDFDGMDPNSFTIGELRRAATGEP